MSYGYGYGWGWRRWWRRRSWQYGGPYGPPSPWWAERPPETESAEKEAQSRDDVAQRDYWYGPPYPPPYYPPPWWVAPPTPYPYPYGPTTAPEPPRRISNVRGIQKGA